MCDFHHSITSGFARQYAHFYFWKWPYIPERIKRRKKKKSYRCYSFKFRNSSSHSQIEISVSFGALIYCAHMWHFWESESGRISHRYWNNLRSMFSNIIYTMCVYVLCIRHDFKFYPRWKWIFSIFRDRFVL